MKLNNPTPPSQLMTLLIYLTRNKLCSAIGVPLRNGGEQSATDQFDRVRRA
jgi:hypothetical protein